MDKEKGLQSIFSRIATLFSVTLAYLTVMLHQTL